MNDALLQFNGIIDEEICAYESLKELYCAKERILVEGNSDEIWEIDSKIMAKADEIRTLDQKRGDCSALFGCEKFTISDAIQKASETNTVLSSKFKSQKEKLNILSKELQQKEKNIMALIEHGMTIVDKTIDIIVDMANPKSQGYNNKGKNVKSSENLISSITEEV